MNIGLITFSRAINYGAVLQSYALKNALMKLGHDCSIINYYCPEIEREISPFYLRSLHPKDIMILFTYMRLKIVKNKKFKLFSDKYLDTSSKLYDITNINEISDSYDAYITGSDQVWNYEITGMDRNYFLDFVSPEKKKISYAASFGVSVIPNELKGQYKELLSNMDYISVREPDGAMIVKDLIGLCSDVMIDPVFLPDKSTWEMISVKPSFKDDYILVYSINKSDCYSVAKKIQSETGLQIIGLQTPISNKTHCCAIRDESPEEFLGWFENAKFIVTDSFHGTAFSIINHKNFICCAGGEGINRLSRQKNLLNSLNLSNRFCEPKDYKTIYEKINYCKVDESVSALRSKSFKFLQSAIN